MRTILLAALFCATSAFAQYPVKPIRIVVPLVPGGNQDIVENRLGQSAIVGTQFVKAAGYNPAADFAGVSLVCRIPQLLVVNANHPARTLQELVSLAKAKPGEVSFGSSGKGNAQAIVDVMGGQIAMMFDQVSTSAAHVRGGKLRALGVTTKTRSAVVPEVPTLHEQGLTDFEDVTWNGLVAPAGTPRDVLVRLNSEVGRVMANAEFRKRYLDRGIEMVASRSPEDFSAYVKSEAEAFIKLVQDAGIKVE